HLPRVLARQASTPRRSGRLMKHLFHILILMACVPSFAHGQGSGPYPDPSTWEDRLTVRLDAGGTPPTVEIWLNGAWFQIPYHSTSSQINYVWDGPQETDSFGWDLWIRIGGTTMYRQNPFDLSITGYANGAAVEVIRSTGEVTQLGGQPSVYQGAQTGGPVPGGGGEVDHCDEYWDPGDSFLWEGWDEDDISLQPPTG